MSILFRIYNQMMNDVVIEYWVHLTGDLCDNIIDER